ncbi:DUF4192 domain-containing protein [Paenarthrobacter sp. NPDC056912]|uniref:DUF4192 domain-containing protein n=1 Tax=Paenarthrobacter sp. NPDC056912 TaxID=3345965 RepID=UPI00366E6CAE
MTTNEALSIHQPEDILGYIPHVLGFWPEDSLVAITMQGRVLGATLRVNLPTPRPPQALAMFADHIRRYLLADGAADGVVLAVYSEAGWADSTMVNKAAPLLEALQQSFGEVDLAVRDAWLVGSEFWRSAYCPDESCCPMPGLPVSCIKDSRLSAEMVYRGSAIGSAPTSPSGQPLNARRGSLDPLVHAAETRYAEEILDQWRSESCLDAVLAVWHHALAKGAAGTFPEPATDAGLMGLLRTTLKIPAWRDAVAVMAAAGIGSAKSGAASSGMLSQGGSRKPPFDLGEFGIPSAAAGDTPSSEARKTGDIFTYGDVLLGMKPEVPHWNHLNALQHVLAVLCVEGETGEVAAASLTLQGWIAWCKGSGSFAYGCLSRVEAAQPGYRLAELLMGILDQGTICGWARLPGSAWRGFKGAVV